MGFAVGSAGMALINICKVFVDAIINFIVAIAVMNGLFQLTFMAGSFWRLNKGNVLEKTLAFFAIDARCIF